MNSVMGLVLVNHKTGEIDVPMIDSSKSSLVYKAKSEYGFSNDAFDFGKDTYTYTTDDGEEIEVVVQEFPGMVVKKLLSQEFVDALNSKVDERDMEACQNGIEPTC